jgi:hypothetical protein
MIRILLFSFIVTLLFSCKKYEQGPYFSIQTKKARIANEWVAGQAFSAEGFNIIDSLTGYTFDFERDGKAQVIFPSGTDMDTVEGDWYFVDDRDLFAWELSGPGEKFYFQLGDTFDIYRLTGSEFWLIDQENSRIALTPAQ